MAILLIRHAEAIGERPGLDDATRWLTERGRAQAGEVGRALLARSLRVARFVASPRVRAVQTAELVVRELRFSGAVEILPSLSFTASAERAANELTALEAELEEGAVVVGVGHMPTIAQTARLLTNGSHGQGLGLCEALLIEGGRVIFSETPG